MLGFGIFRDAESGVSVWVWGFGVEDLSFSWGVRSRESFVQ